jgi:transposase
MLGRTSAVTVWARSRPTDLRLGFRGLAGLVRSEFHRNLQGGDLFLFVNARRTSAKVLLWDGSGLCIYAKRLSAGRFAALWRGGGGGQPLRLDTTELNLFLERATVHRAPSSRSK